MARPGVLPSAASMPTQLEIAMNIMIRTFHHYSCREGDRFKLNKGELKMLLQRELTEFLSVSLTVLPVQVRGWKPCPSRDSLCEYRLLGSVHTM